MPRRSDDLVDHSTAVYIHEFIAPQVEAHKEQHRELLRRLQAQEDEIRALKKQIATLTASFSEINNLWTNIAGFYTAKEFQGKQTEDDNRHHDVAAEYRLFRDNQMFQLVTNPQWVSRPLSAPEQALARSRLSMALFGSDPAPEAVRAALREFGIRCPDVEIEAICREATTIKQQAARLGRDQGWDFSRGDGRFDPARQERVAGSAGSEAGEIVAYVVAPGYTVADGQVVIQQLVLTQPAPR